MTEQHTHDAEEHAEINNQLAASQRARNDQLDVAAAIAAEVVEEEIHLARERETAITTQLANLLSAYHDYTDLQTELTTTQKTLTTTIHQLTAQHRLTKESIAKALGISVRKLDSVLPPTKTRRRSPRTTGRKNAAQTTSNNQNPTNNSESTPSPSNEHS